MANKWSKVVMLLVLCFAVIVGACSNNGGNSSNSGSGGTNQSNTESNGGNQGSGTTEPPMELTWFISSPNIDPNAILPSASDDFVKQLIEEKFNVKLDLQYMIQGQDYENRLNLLLASDPPDLFTPNGTHAGTLINQGVAADLTEFVTPQTMPNYFKNWISEVEIQRYQLPGGFLRAPKPFVRNVYMSYYIRKDWLDNLGLPVPDSYDALLDTMRKFTFDDPDRNGNNDTWGFSASGGGLNWNFDFPQLLHHGYIGATMIRDDEYVDVQTDPGIEDVLNDIKAMLAEGIVDPDWFLNQNPAHVNKAVQGQVGIVKGTTIDFALDANPESLQSRSKQINPQAEWIPFNPFPDAAGIWGENLPGDAFQFYTETAEKNPEKIRKTVEILDWLAGEEGFRLTHYGQEGVHYTLDGNQILFNPEQFKQDITDRGNWLSIYAFFTPNEPNDMGFVLVQPDYTERDIAIIEEVSGYKKIPSIGTNVAPPQGYNIGDFRQKMREYQVRILFDEPDASKWPEYRKELMETYHGKIIFEEYAKQISAAQDRDIVFNAGVE